MSVVARYPFVDPCQHLSLPLQYFVNLQISGVNCSTPVLPASLPHLFSLVCVHGSVGVPMLAGCVWVVCVNSRGNGRLKLRPQLVGPH